MPNFRAVVLAGNGSTGSSVPLSFAIPSTAVPGDVALVVTDTAAASTITESGPTDGTWTLVDTIAPTSNNNTTRFYAKQLDSTDPGATRTWNLSAARIHVGVMIIMSNASGWQPDTTNSHTGTTSQSTIVAPAISLSDSGSSVVGFYTLRTSGATPGDVTVPAAYTRAGASKTSQSTNQSVIAVYDEAAAGDTGGESITVSAGTVTVWDARYIEVLAAAPPVTASLDGQSTATGTLAVGASAPGSATATGSASVGLSSAGTETATGSETPQLSAAGVSSNVGSALAGAVASGSSTSAGTERVALSIPGVSALTPADTVALALQGVSTSLGTEVLSLAVLGSSTLVGDLSTSQQGAVTGVSTAVGLEQVGLATGGVSNISGLLSIGASLAGLSITSGTMRVGVQAFGFSSLHGDLVPQGVALSYNDYVARGGAWVGYNPLFARGGTWHPAG